jgi:uroporphyrinogen decarboxylase
MATMTSRERALAALNHEEPDMVPIDVGGLVLFTCLHEIADRKVKEYLGFEQDEQVVNSMFSRTVRPNPAIRDRFQTDFFGLAPKAGSNWTLEIVQEEDGSEWFVDEWQIKWRRPAGGFYFDLVSSPMAGVQSPAEVAKYNWPDPTDPARLDGVVEFARDLYENTDYCICFTPAWGTGYFQASGMFQGWEDHYVNALVNPDITRAVLDGLLEFNIAQCGAILDAVGDYIQVILMSDDLGFQDRPMIRMHTFRDLVKPYYVKTVDFIKSKRPDIKIVFHSDGAIYPFLEEFIDVGLDATNPVQVSCTGMDDTAKLKREFGDKLTFWGAGVDTQSTLPHGTPEDVRAEVQRRIRDLAPGGGYIFATVHNVQADVPPENIVACYDAAAEFRHYPIT